VRTSSSESAAAAPVTAVSGRSLALRALGIAGFVGLIALGAHLKIGGPVPFTLQTLFVLLAGALLGPADAAAAVCLYLAAGAMAVPVFANPAGAAGAAYFKGVTGGYLVGFVAAALLTGLAARRTQRVYMLACAFAGAALVILAFGAAHLWLVCGRTPAQALWTGFIPFLPGDMLKAFLAFVLYRRLRGGPQPS
jgi:biotin transport system substrate-specific component